MNYIKKIYNLLKNKIINMTNLQKLYLALVFLVFIFLLTRLMTNISTNTLNVNYNDVNGGILYPLTNEILDKDIYIKLKSVADEFISICRGNFLKNNTNITLEDIYEFALYSEYKNSVSKKEFVNKSQEFYNKLISIDPVNQNFVPYNITQYKGDFYLVKYNYTVNDSTFECYLGIALSSSENKYYIWYVE